MIRDYGIGIGEETIYVHVHLSTTTKVYIRIVTSRERRGEANQVQTSKRRNRVNRSKRSKMNAKAMTKICLPMTNKRVDNIPNAVRAFDGLPVVHLTFAKRHFIRVHLSPKKPSSTTSKSMSGIRVVDHVSTIPASVSSPSYIDATIAFQTAPA